MKHDMEEIRDQWHYILDQLIEHTQFELYLKGEWDYYTWRYKFDRELPDGIWGASGATRVVFGFDSNPTVVFKMLQDRDGIDYNASEAFIYNCAVDAGVEQWFAWTEKVETIDYNGVKTDIYAMDFCEVNGEQLEQDSYDLAIREYLDDEGMDLDEMTDDEKENMYSMIDSCECGDSEGIRHYMYATYDCNDMDDLYNFIDDYNINDTHAGNWGYYDGHLVLIDFGGYERNLIQMAREAA